MFLGGLDLNMEPPQDVYVQVLAAAAPQDVNTVQGGLYTPPQVLAAAHINGSCHTFFSYSLLPN